MPYKDPEISRAYHAAYRALHREKAVIYSRAYRRGIRAQRPPKQTQEERLVKHRIYNNAHHEEILAYAKGTLQHTKNIVKTIGMHIVKKSVLKIKYMLQPIENKDAHITKPIQRLTKDRIKHDAQEKRM